MQLKTWLTSSTYKELSKDNDSWKEVDVENIRAHSITIDLDSLVFFYMRKYLERVFSVKKQRRMIRAAFVKNVEIATKQAIRELANFSLEEFRQMVKFVDDTMKLQGIYYSKTYPKLKLELRHERLERQKVLEKEIPKTEKKKKLQRYITQYLLGFRDNVRDIIVSKFSHKLLHEVEETDRVCPQHSKWVMTEDVDIFLFGNKHTVILKPFLIGNGIPETFFRNSCKKYLANKGIQYCNFVDIAFLMGTDYNRGIKGMGVKRSVAAISKYGTVLEFLVAKYDITDAGEMLEVYQRFVEYVCPK